MSERLARNAKIFLATPMYDGRVHHAYMMGAVQLALEFPGEVIMCKVGGSYLPSSHDRLTQLFMQSSATHLLFVNSDMIWTPADALQLLAANREFVSGIYGKKRVEARAVTPERRQGDLLELEYTGAGFMLLQRGCVERLAAAHPELVYDTPDGPAHSLWSPHFDGQVYSADRTFCGYWRGLGGQIWGHTGVVLKRFGETVYVPDGFTQRTGS